MGYNGSELNSEDCEPPDINMHLQNAYISVKVHGVSMCNFRMNSIVEKDYY